MGIATSNPTSPVLPTFLLGTHMPAWMRDSRFVGVTLFISVNRLRRGRPLPPSRHDVCLDSGGFTELKQYGTWRTGPEEYAALVRRLRAQLGEERVRWAAPQDWMCEPQVIFGANHHLPPHHPQYFRGTTPHHSGRAGRTDREFDLAVRLHQERTIENFLELRRLAPDQPFIPVLQGWAPRHYLRCLDLYGQAGVALEREPLVGLGSVCRRQHTAEIGNLVQALTAAGLRLHGFGVKREGLAQYGRYLASADSLAWSAGARYNPPLAGHLHKSCSSCPEWALRWYAETQAVLRHTSP
ncbi:MULTISPECIES: hypothetical protein [Streptomyces]|uniref:deazapurine DNA modification protein DpdA family protein n=1 Tax=Streptomyces TaxID=1883 RepID=UPI0020CA8A68|nr:hypothetical protein [Streptomyces odorifer]